MIIKILFKFLVGYIRVSIEGYYVERFINICTNNKILIWNLKKDEGIKLYFNTGIHEFRELVQIAKKTQCKIKIEKKRGVPFLLNRYRKRKIFALLLLMVFIVIQISSTYIWNIDICIEDNKVLENIEDDISKSGLIIGRKKSKIDTKEIINNIRLNRDDISWIGIEIKGTNAVVKIVEADKKPEIIPEEEYCNIVATKDGIIVKVSAVNGTPLVKEGTTIKKALSRRR